MQLLLEVAFFLSRKSTNIDLLSSIRSGSDVIMAMILIYPQLDLDIIYVIYCTSKQRIIHV